MDPCFGKMVLATVDPYISVRPLVLMTARFGLETVDCQNVEKTWGPLAATMMLMKLVTAWEVVEQGRHAEEHL